MNVRGLSVRENVKTGRKDFDKTEDDLKALQSVGQIIGEVLRQLDSERCEYSLAPCGRFLLTLWLQWMLVISIGSLFLSLSFWRSVLVSLMMSSSLQMQYQNVNYRFKVLY